MTRMMIAAVATTALAVLLSACTAVAPEPEASPAPSPVPSAVACPPEPDVGGEPEITCVFPGGDVAVWCAKFDQRLAFELQWSSRGADRAFVAAGTIDDAESAALAGPLAAADATELTIDCRHEAAMFTLTVKGSGGMATEHVTVLRRLP